MNHPRNIAVLLLCAMLCLPSPGAWADDEEEPQIIITHPEYFDAEDYPERQFPTIDGGDTPQDDSKKDDSSKEQPSVTPNPHYTDDVIPPEIVKNHAVTYTDPKTKKKTQAQWEQIGSVYSVIRMNGQTQKVLTSRLTFADGVPARQKLAVIYAPKIGQAKMRNKGNVKATMIYTCKAGRLAAVLKVGKGYTQINYQGAVGYVKTSSLKFCAALSAKKVSTGKLSYNGRMTGRTDINVRNDPSGKAIAVASWPTGTEVTVLSLKDGWYEIEARGIRGYVMEEYLTKD